MQAKKKKAKLGGFGIAKEAKPFKEEDISCENLKKRLKISGRE